MHTHTTNLGQILHYDLLSHLALDQKPSHRRSCVTGSHCRSCTVQQQGGEKVRRSWIKLFPFTTENPVKCIFTCLSSEAIRREIDWIYADARKMTFSVSE